MAVDSPRSEDAFGEAVFSGTTDVIHDLVTTVFDDGVANTRGDRVERFVPRCAFPFSFATLTGAFEWIKNAIGICYLDRELRYVRINATLAAMNGLSVEAHLGRTIYDLFPDQAPLLESVLRPVLNTGQARLGVEISAPRLLVPNPWRVAPI